MYKILSSNGKILFLPFFLLFINSLAAQRAKDGAENYSPGGSTTYILNRYVTLNTTATAGATSITVSAIGNLAGTFSFTNSTNPYTTSSLAPGDLVMIMQMQGADMTTTDNSSYGNITNYNDVGVYEIRVVQSISSNTITFCTAITNTYTVSGRRRAQVVRIPRLSSLTVGTNGIISAMPWNGTVGGICALEVDGNMVVNGRIDVSNDGFRGGTDPDPSATSNNGANVVTLYRTTATSGATTASAGKGESIVGTIADYASLNGANGRGAPANGGGGGNGRQTGGGGGSNAGNNGSLTPWNGTGIKASGYNNAWNLEAANFATDISRGGGRGGYSRSGSNQNALTLAPGSAAWADDYRDNVGGFGGRPLDNSSNTRLFLGGGGGAGEGDNDENGDGGIGGGIAYLLVKGTVTGSGSIRANGQAGGNSTDRDGAGGGGGGGAVVLFCNSTITGISIQANGGVGGNNTRTNAEAHGPGGGGGGGYIYTTTTSVTRTVNGGANGVTSSTSLTEFPPNGATQGDAGTIVATGTYFQPNDCWKEINNFSSVACTPSSVTISASNTHVNTYYPSVASVSAGSTRISLGDVRTGGVTTPILPGDLLMVIQMQGATINSTNTSNYGSNTGVNRGYLTTVAGTYEYVYAASGVVGNTVYLATPLLNSYSHIDYDGTNGQYRYQVIRVPEYTNLTINGGSSITCLDWDGSTGGVIATNIRGNLNFNGGVAIDARAMGFRGGGGRQLGGGSGASSDLRTLSTNNAMGSKGEGIAGTPKYTRSNANLLIDNGPEGYPNGSYSQGAPGNAGGGGVDGNPSSNDENTGGGGGGNGGIGGRGGRAWNDPAVYGGYGGAVFAAASSTRLVMGGGGGAGTTNNGTGPTGTNGFSSSGGNGGGMVFIKTNAVTGTATIAVDGSAGLSVDNDGAGGGGAAGSIYIYSNNTAGLVNVTALARGGGGGSAWAGIADNGTPDDGNPEHGPGGGGAGGIVYSNGALSGSTNVTGGANGITTTANRPYGATPGGNGSVFTSAINVPIPVRTFCDIDDDDDGIADVVENPSSVDPFEDPDNDGIPTMYDDVTETGVPWADNNADGVNDNFDADLDGIINELDLDSDNDGIPDVIESYGVDTDGSGRIDNFTDANGDGLSDNAAVTNAVDGIGAPDFDGDGVPNYLDLDSDNDGLPDILEAQGTDSNNDGQADSFADADFDGFNDNVEGSVNGILKSGTDGNGDGLADSWPNKNGDGTGRANPYDLDSDGDGISDYEESGLRAALGRPVSESNRTIAHAGSGYTNGWSNNVDGLASITLTNTDANGQPNYLDIDSDNDGITDNIEGIATTSYAVSSDTDTDNDGLVDTYDSQTGTFGGNALTPFDKDNDGIPDYIDTDTDGDGVPDRNEGDRNNPFRTITQATINASGDTDGDGLMDVFDSFNLLTATAGNFFKNYSMSQMGTGGNYNGPTPSGSVIQLQQSEPTGDRDWREITVLPLNILEFNVNYVSPIATLKWDVVNEQIVHSYILERSIDGTNFSTIHESLATNRNNASYLYPDNISLVQVATVFYRIKQVNKDGKVFYTRIIPVKLISKNVIKATPNPFQNSISVTFQSSSKKSIQVSIIDILGKTMFTKAYIAEKGNNVFNVDNLSQLAAGTYLLKITSNEGNFIDKIIKQ